MSLLANGVPVHNLACRNCIVKRISSDNHKGVCTVDLAVYPQFIVQREPGKPKLAGIASLNRAFRSIRL